MSDDSNRSLDSVSRRRFLLASAVSGAAGLSGCSEGTNENETDAGDDVGSAYQQEEDAFTSDDGTATTIAGRTESDGQTDGTYKIPFDGTLNRANFNLWVPQNNAGGQVPAAFFEKLTHHVRLDVSWHPWLASDWSIEPGNGEAMLQIREGVNWHSGEPVRATDVANHFRLARLVGDPIWDYANSVEATDEYTVAFELDRALEEVLQSYLLTDWTIHTHPELYREFIEAQADATTDSEREAIQSDLLQYTISPEEAMGTMGNGPFDLVEVNESEMQFRLRDDYPFDSYGTGDPNWSKLTATDYGEGEQGTRQAAIADELDTFSGTTSKQVRKQLGDHWEMLSKGRYQGHAVNFGRDSIFGQDTEESRYLRQAIAYIFDPLEWVKVYGERVSATPMPNMCTGMVGPMANAYLGDEFLSSLTSYGDADSGWVKEDKAVEKMEQAGYEREDGVWVDTDTGEQLIIDSYDFPAGWPGNVPSYRNVAEQLTDFGIETEPNGRENTTYFGDILSGHNFQLSIDLYGGGPHPQQAFRGGLGTLSTVGNPYNNMREELTVPWPPGNPDGELQTVNVDDRILELGEATDSEREQELIRELTWIHNQWTPKLHTENGVLLGWLSTDDWDYGVSEDAPIFESNLAWSYFIRTGQLQYK